MKNLFIFSMILLVTIACKQKKAITKQTISHNYVISNEDSIAHLLLVDTLPRLSFPLKYTIKGATVKDGILEIQIQYSGGCKDQLFSLVSTGVNNDNRIKVQLLHDNKEDLCKKLILKTLYFDLASLGESEGTKTLLLNQFRGVLLF